MASVTYIKSIANNTPYTLTLINGENSSYMFAIGAQSAWNGSMAVPWIGKVEENYKALQLILGPRSETKIWLFQDYWLPAHKDAVKYITGSAMDYKGSTEELPGNNRDGGNKNLIINLVKREFEVTMV
ncbi:hypothetical protein [Pseudomonas sp. H9]|uniref:hypothetical protein n=1 Tax=Pseudomonas sp. H9 TaxID=483968 RepID=UPI0010582095|nr:hypothetical protein [Pseudomonas sp. H9]TDF86718.1 hypothetical protein E1573_00745 [Pseudomonas sp. H9]